MFLRQLLLLIRPVMTLVEHSQSLSYCECSNVLLCGVNLSLKILGLCLFRGLTFFISLLAINPFSKTVIIISTIIYTWYWSENNCYPTIVVLSFIVVKNSMLAMVIVILFNFAKFAQ